MKDTDIIAAIAPDAVSLMDKAIAEIKRLRQENATLTAERDALFVLTDRLTAERDEARRRFCEYAIRNGRVYRRVGSDTLRCETPKEVAEMMGWDCKENTID